MQHLFQERKRKERLVIYLSEFNPFDIPEEDTPGMQDTDAAPRKVSSPSGLNQSRAFISMFAAIFISSMTLPIIQAIGARSSERAGFAITIGAYGALQALCYLCVFWLTRGYDRQEPRVQRAPGETAGKEMFKSLGYIVKNPLWRWLAAGTMLYYTCLLYTSSPTIRCWCAAWCWCWRC